MSIPSISGSDFGGPENAGLLLLGPSLGTSAAALWTDAATLLREHVRVIAWDLPGHGLAGPAESFTIAELAAGVLGLIDEFSTEPVHYAGNSVSGCVGLQLLLDAPERVASATLLCTGAKIGNPEGWRQHIASVRAAGIEAALVGAADRLFGPGFPDRQPGVSTALLQALGDTDPTSYMQVCEALAAFDVADRLDEIDVPVLAVAGGEDRSTPPRQLQYIASGVKDGRYVALDGVGHLAPAEAPAEVARLIGEHIGR